MRPRVVAITLMIVGVLVAAAALMLALSASMDMDPPYESVKPYLRVALGGAAVLVLGGVVLWSTIYGGMPREPDPFDRD